MTANLGLRLAFAGGGTGGHVVPGLHLLTQLQIPESGPCMGRLEDLLWFGAGRAVEDRVLSGLEDLVGEASHERVALALEPAGGGAPSLGGLSLRLLPAVLKARSSLKRHRSQVLLGLGGFTTVPAVLAARSLGIPITLLEINAVPGRATRWLSRFATHVFHAWPSTLPGGVETERHLHVGPPLPHVVTSKTDLIKEVAPVFPGLSDPLLLVLGGSQGALGLNRFLAAQTAALVEGGVFILHQVGPGRLDEAAPEQPGYRAVEYLDDVPAALRAATFVLCRGGASTLAEVGAMGKPAWVVPYPHHQDRHQERNAEMLGDGVRVVQEADLDTAHVAELCGLLSANGTPQRAAMSAALGSAVPSTAAASIVEVLVSLGS
ncbi:MAG: UDP-N-acetylglucosamine--N-acetylmuramyl-(pentapeptide) pyrophosphoryl-undecaprenol N-acetylglucosamine transferase [Planctomycetota bacterium]|jgi:UDP-N-acetylglucosamine--N-acetylmuramyl-(pentapeptide) pyrophosphoryl-undecaprenol N-acetylglucosamine transferase